MVQINLHTSTRNYWVMLQIALLIRSLKYLATMCALNVAMNMHDDVVELLGSLSVFVNYYPLIDINSI